MTNLIRIANGKPSQSFECQLLFDWQFAYRIELCDQIHYKHKLCINGRKCILIKIITHDIMLNKNHYLNTYYVNCLNK